MISLIDVRFVCWQTMCACCCSLRSWLLVLTLGIKCEWWVTYRLGSGEWPTHASGPNSAIVSVFEPARTNANTRGYTSPGPSPHGANELVASLVQGETHFVTSVRYSVYMGRLFGMLYRNNRIIRFLMNGCLWVVWRAWLFFSLSELNLESFPTSWQGKTLHCPFSCA